MKDKEIEKQAEECTINAICEACNLCSSKGYIGCEKYRCGKQAFQDGAKWGIANAIQWHDLRENPDDLPKENGEYWCKWEDGTYSTGHYFTDYGFGSYVIAWCELPKFKE